MESKKVFKNLLRKINENENTIEEYIENFNSFFDVEVKNEQSSNLLKNIFINFVSLAYKPTKTNKFLISRMTEVEKEFSKTFTSEQSKLFDIYDFLEIEYSNYYSFKAFMYGYCFGKELSKEEENFTKKVDIKSEINKLNNNTCSE